MKSNLVILKLNFNISSLMTNPTTPHKSPKQEPKVSPTESRALYDSEVSSYFQNVDPPGKSLVFQVMFSFADTFLI